MEERSIEYIRWLRNDVVPQITINTYKPRSDYAIEVYPYTNQNAKYVQSMFLEHAKAGHRIYGMITSN